MIKTVLAVTLLSNLLLASPTNEVNAQVDLAVPNTTYAATLVKSSVEKHNSIFDEFIQNRIDMGYTHIEETFTDEFINNLVTICEENEIDPWLVLAVMDAESSYDPNAKAYDGSKHYGLMQLSVYYFSDELEEEGTDDFFDPVANSSVGAKELKRLIEQAKKYKCTKKSSFDYPFETLAVYSYHIGEGNAVPNYKEGIIDDYTIKVIKNWQSFKNQFAD